MVQLGQGPPVIRVGRSLFAKSSVTEWLRSKEQLSGKKSPPQLNVIAALRELETHGENGAARRLFLSERGEPLSPREVEDYLRRPLAAGIKALPLALV